MLFGGNTSCVYESLLSEMYPAVCLIAGHVDFAGCSVTRLICQVAETMAWFVILMTAKIRGKNYKKWDALHLSYK